MSNTLGHSLLHQSLYRPTVLDHQTRATSGVSIQATLHLKKPFVPTKLYENLNVKKGRVLKGAGKMASVVPHALLTTENPSGLAGKFNLDGNSELLIDVTATPGNLLQLDIQVTNSSDSLMLHWGGISDTQKNWILPARQPDGTKVYKNRALRTPFIKSGSSSFLKMEIDDHNLQAIEFLIVDEGRNRWFKDKGNNFRVQLSWKEKPSSSSVPEDLVQVPEDLVQVPEDLVQVPEDLVQVPEDLVQVPEDLVQIQAYVRWERKGKQMYTPAQEKDEYEAARAELLEELARGLSVEEIRKNITRKDDTSKIQGVKIRVTKRSKQPERIQRKKRGFMQILNKYAIGLVEENSLITSKAPTAIEVFSKVKEEQDEGAVLNKQIYKIDDKKILAASGLTFGVVPFVSKRSLGVVSGMTGSGGTLGAVVTQLLLFSGVSSFSTQTGISLMGVMMLVCTLPLTLMYFQHQGGMFCGPGDHAEDYFELD